MKWFLYDTVNDNIIIDAQEEAFTGLLPNQAQVELDFTFPLDGLVPWHIFRYNGTTLESSAAIDKTPFLVMLKPSENYRLYKYLHDTFKGLMLDLTIPPKGIDYIINVTPKMKKTTEQFDEHGFLVSAVWSAYDWENDQIIEELLKVDITYELLDDAAINAAKTVVGRQVSRQWILEDGTYKADLSDVKVTNKDYPTYMHRKAQGQIRRRNIAAMTEEAFVTLVTILHTAGDQEAAEALGKGLFAKMLTAFSAYLDVGAPNLMDAITAEAEEPYNTVLNIVIPDAAPVNLLYPNAVGMTIRNYLIERYSANLM